MSMQTICDLCGRQETGNENYQMFFERDSGLNIPIANADMIDVCARCWSRIKQAMDECEAEEKQSRPDACVELPLDADGKPIHVGDAVYFESEVAKVCGMRWSGASWSLSLHDRAEDTASHRCRLVPTAALVGADGVPIGVGDIVYRDDTPEPLQVDLIYAGSMGYCTVRLKDSAGIYTSADAPRLSHKKPEPPDSWEKLEEDVMKATTCLYFGDVESTVKCWDCPHGFEQSGTPCWKNEYIDILKRAKKLAGIEEEAVE